MIKILSLNWKKETKIILLLIIVCFLVTGCQNTQQKWGQGEVHPEWKKYFGNSNISRLLYHKGLEENKRRRIRAKINECYEIDIEAFKEINKQYKVQLEALGNSDIIFAEQDEKLERMIEKLEKRYDYVDVQDENDND